MLVLIASLTLPGPVRAETWRGLAVAPESRCTSYERARDYRYLGRGGHRAGSGSRLRALHGALLHLDAGDRHRAYRRDERSPRFGSGSTRGRVRTPDPRPGARAGDAGREGGATRRPGAGCIQRAGSGRCGIPSYETQLDLGCRASCGVVVERRVQTSWKQGSVLRAARRDVAGSGSVSGGSGPLTPALVRGPAKPAVRVATRPVGPRGVPFRRARADGPSPGLARPMLRSAVS